MLKSSSWEIVSDFKFYARSDLNCTWGTKEKFIVLFTIIGIEKYIYNNFITIIKIII